MKHSDLRRFGVIAPAGNMAIEWEFSRHLPTGFAFNHSRVGRPGGALLTRQSLLAMAEAVERAATDLVRTRPEIILYGCTSGSFIAGPGTEAEIALKITSLTGVEAVTTSTAVIEALRHLGTRSVFLVTPYPDDINAQEVAFLEHHGFTVNGHDSFRCDAAYPIGVVDSAETSEMVLRNRVQAERSDAVFISCTNLLTFDQIPRLEATLGRAVISSNQASLWAVLNRMRAVSPAAGVGLLFNAPAGAASI